MELLMVILIFICFITVGASSAIFESRSEKKASSWGFHVPESRSSAATVPQAIEQAYVLKTISNATVAMNDIVTPVVQPKVFGTIEPEISIESFDLQNTNISIAEFEQSIIPDEVTTSLNQLMSDVNNELEKGNESSSKLNPEMVQSIEKLIGPRVSKLVTAQLSSLIENEEVVIIGKYENHSISYDNTTLNVTSEDAIHSDSEEYIVVKGMLLPNGNFRILQWEDAETVECGFAGEEFLLTTHTA